MIDRRGCPHRETLDLPSSIFNPLSIQVINQRIGQRAGLYAHGGVHQHARRLDYYDQLIIFVKNFERYWLWGHSRGRGVIEGNLDRVTNKDAVAWATDGSIYQTRSRLDKVGDSHAA